MKPVAIAVSASLATAGELVHVVDFGGSTSENRAFSETLAFPMFDAMDGKRELQAVEYSWNFSLDGAAPIRFIANEPSDLEIAIGGSFFVASAPGAAWLDLDGGTIHQEFVFLDAQPQDVFANEFADLRSNVDSRVIEDANDLAVLIGQGEAEASIGFEWAIVSVSPRNSIQQAGVWMATYDGQLMVTYRYVPTPWVVPVAAVGMLTRRRRPIAR